MEYCSLPMDPVLENIKLRILRIINNTWDTGYIGDEVTYNLSPKHVYDVLRINILTYPVNSELIYFKSHTVSDTIDNVFVDFLPILMPPVNIVCTAEGGYDLYLAVHNVKEVLKSIVELAKKNKVTVKLSNASSDYSRHVYVEFIKELDETNQKLVFLMIVKK